jgi:hypothetical protein
MQTFLPYSSFAESARVLDWRRLGKQRVETLQILRTLAGLSKGWSNHPAVRMWRGYESALRVYGAVICLEWRNRGYRDKCLDKILDMSSVLYAVPPWLGDPAFHASHRAALLAKDPEWYGQWGWTETPGIEYVWPVG